MRKNGEIRFERSVDVRFVGQGSETNIAVPNENFSTINPQEIRKRFDQVYEKLYGRTYPRFPQLNSSISRFGQACRNAS